MEKCKKTNQIDDSNNQKDDKKNNGKTAET